MLQQNPVKTIQILEAILWIISEIANMGPNILENAVMVGMIYASRSIHDVRKKLQKVGKSVAMALSVGEHCFTVWNNHELKKSQPPISSKKKGLWESKHELGKQG